MRKLIVTLAATMVVAAVPLWQAQTASWRDPGVAATTKNFTPIEKAACRGWGPFCPPGRTRVCGPVRCWCAPCW